MTCASRAFSVVAAAGLACAGTANAQVVNGGFETGDLTGWTQFGNVGSSGVAGGAVPHSGSFGGFFGPVGSHGGITQNVAGVVAGKRYDVDFWLHADGRATAFFQARFGNLTLVTQNNPPADPYSHYVFTNVVASAN